MADISAFKNYKPGDPTCRLYIKNLAKHVEEKVNVFYISVVLAFRKTSVISVSYTHLTLPTSDLV